MVVVALQIGKCYLPIEWLNVLLNFRIIKYMAVRVAHYMLSDPGLREVTGPVYRHFVKV